jgi:integrase/recombinase XerD
MKECLGEFLVYLEKNRGSYKNTIASYKRDLNKLIIFLAESKVINVERITATHLNTFLLKAEDDGNHS